MFISLKRIRVSQFKSFLRADTVSGCCGCSINPSELYVQCREMLLYLLVCFSFFFSSRYTSREKQQLCKFPLKISLKNYNVK